MLTLSFTFLLENKREDFRTQVQSSLCFSNYKLYHSVTARFELFP